MKQKSFLTVLLAEAAVCVLLALLQPKLSGIFTAVVAFPMEQIAIGLRHLSLSGAGGNIAAICIYVLLSLTPLALLLRKNRKYEDLFGILLSGMLFLSLYCMINPGLISQTLTLPMGDKFEKAMLGSMFYSLLASYLVLRLVRSFFHAERSKLIQYLQILLWAFCLLLVYQVFYGGLDGLIRACTDLRAGNKGNEHLLGFSYVFLVLQYMIDVLPYILDIILVYWVLQLLQAERNSAESVTIAHTLSRWCGISLVVMVLTSTAYHIAQLLFLPRVFQSSVQVDLPLFSLLFALAVLLMSQYIQENQELKNDNDLFI